VAGERGSITSGSILATCWCRPDRPGGCCFPGRARRPRWVVSGRPVPIRRLSGNAGAIRVGAVSSARTNQRDGSPQSRVHTGRTAYSKNTLGAGCPAIADERVFQHYQQKVDGHRSRKRAASFQDDYSQATLFWNSLSEWERGHIVAAFRFELGNCDHTHVREAVVERLNRIDHALATQVAEGIGVKPPATEAQPVRHHPSSGHCQRSRRRVSCLAGKALASGTPS
jgi:catalase